MEKIVKQVVGIDVAQNELVVCLGRIDERLQSELYAHKTFLNNQKGFLELVDWTKKDDGSRSAGTFCYGSHGGVS
jgi:transposase